MQEIKYARFCFLGVINGCIVHRPHACGDPTDGGASVREGIVDRGEFEHFVIADHARLFWTVDILVRCHVPDVERKKEQSRLNVEF